MSLRMARQTRGQYPTTIGSLFQCASVCCQSRQRVQSTGTYTTIPVICSVVSLKVRPLQGNPLFLIVMSDPNIARLRRMCGIFCRREVHRETSSVIFDVSGYNWELDFLS